MIHEVDWSGLGGVVFWALVVGFSIVLGSWLEQRREERRTHARVRRRLMERLDEASRPDGP